MKQKLNSVKETCTQGQSARVMMLYNCSFKHENETKPFSRKQVMRSWLLPLFYSLTYACLMLLLQSTVHQQNIETYSIAGRALDSRVEGLGFDSHCWSWCRSAGQTFHSILHLSTRQWWVQWFWEKNYWWSKTVSEWPKSIQVHCD